MSEKPEMNLDEMPDPMMEFIDRKMLQDQKRPSGISLFFKGILNVLTLGIFRNRLFPKNDLSEYYGFESEPENSQPIVQNAKEKPVVEKTAEPIKEEKVIAENHAVSPKTEEKTEESKTEEKTEESKSEENEEGMQR